MFDLFRTRQKYVRFMLGAVLVIVALAMVITLIPGYGGMGSGQSEDVLAEIAGQTLTASEARQEIQQRINMGQLSDQQAEQMAPLLVNQMIAERIVAYEAQRLGFQMSDAAVADSIRQLLPQLFQDGQFAGKQAYEALLGRLNLSIPQFEARVRTAALQDQLTNLALDGIVVTPEEIRKEFIRRNQKVKIAYIGVAQQQLAQKVTVTDAELHAEYEGRKKNFVYTESKDFQLFILNANAIASTIQVSDADLRNAYAQERDQFMTPERVKVRHILIMTTGKSAEEKAKLHQKAEDILKQLKAGADFAKLAKEDSNDPASAANGGEMGWIVRGQTVPNFEQVAFSLPLHKLSNVIETEYGYHIIEVLEHQQAHVQPFEDVKQQLLEQVRKQDAYNRVQSLADQLRAAAVRSLPEAEAMAKANKVDVLTVNDIRQDQGIPALGGDATFTATLWELPKNGITPVLTVGPDELAFGRLAGVTPARQASFDEVKARLTNEIKSRKSLAELTNLAKELPAMMAADGNDLNKLAKQVDGKITTSSEFTADGAIDGFGPALAMPDVFTKPVGTLVGPYTLSGQVAVAKILERADPDMAKLAEQRATIYQDLRTRQEETRRELLYEGIFQALADKGKVKVNQKAIMQLAQSYHNS